MAYFGTYIRQILSRQEAAIFPGFGSLIFKESKGIESGKGKIDPPGAQIRFDPEHPKDDGKLAFEYAEGEGIELEEAQQQLLELVDAIKFKLDKGEVYEMPLLGKFSRDDDNKIHFHKDENWVIDPELFGLSTLELLEIDAEEEENTEVVNKQEMKEEAPVDNSEEKPAPVLIERKPVNKWKIIWIVVGSLLAVLVLLLLIPTPEVEDGIKVGKDGIVLKNSHTQHDSESGQEIEKPVKNEPVVQEGEVKGNIEEQAKTPDKPTVENHYFIIAGSFQNLQNANDLVNQLKAKGFPAELIITDTRMYRVSIKAYPTKDEAFDDLLSVKSGSGLESAWVWKR